jgi:hypothetical protein
MRGEVYTSTGERRGASTGKGSFSCLGIREFRPVSLVAITLKSSLSSCRSSIRLFALYLLHAKMKKPASRRKAPIPAPMPTALTMPPERDLLGCGVVVPWLVEGGLIDDGVGPGVVAMFMVVGSANNGASSLRYMTVIG